MFKVKNLSTPFSWVKNVGELSNIQNTWLVADLDSKIEIQNQLFFYKNIIADNNVLRAAEFWIKMLSNVEPTYKTLNISFLKTFLGECLEGEEEDWLKVPGASKNLLDYIEQFLPLVISETSDETLAAWWEANPNSLIKWGRWYFYAKKYLNLILDKGWFLPSWAPYLLYYKYIDKLKWNTSLDVLLGGQISLIESKLFIEISKQSEVTIWTPNINLEKFKLLKSCYEEFGFSSPKNSQIELNNNIEFKRFSTSLSEIKDVCAQIRIWLSQGVLPNEITLYMGDIEKYWPVLQPYLKVENIPVKKNLISRFQSFRSVNRWISRLKIELNKISFEDLEMDLFANNKMDSPINYNDFIKLYSVILKDSHLNRNSSVFERYSHKDEELNKPVNKPVSREIFLIWALKKIHDNENHEILKLLVDRFFQNSSENTKLEMSSWLEYLGEIASKSELTIQDKNVNGIQIKNLGSLLSPNTKKVYFLGLSEAHLSSPNRSKLSDGEKNRIHQDLGIYMDSNNSRSLEFEVEWLLGCMDYQKICSFSQTQFSGEPDAPNLVWLENAYKLREDIEKIDSPQISFWDQIQRQSDNKNAEILNFINRDLGKIQFDGTPLKEVNKLSISRLQNYAKCPFIFSAESNFKLTDPSVLDLDMDPRISGQLYHKILQNLVSSPFNTQLSDVEINEILVKSKDELKLSFFENSDWVWLEAKLKVFIKNFLEYEAKYRVEFPQTETIGKEVKFKVYWDHEINNFIKKNNSNKCIEFTGTIDRVDIDSNFQAMVLDYKNSGDQLVSFKSWIEKNLLQLSVYSYLLDKGYTHLKISSVVGMGYYILKDFDRSYGVWCDEGQGTLFQKKTDKNVINKEDLNQHWKEVLIRVSEIIDSILKGEFPPKPSDTKHCLDCKWSRICRTPHLN